MLVVWGLCSQRGLVAEPEAPCLLLYSFRGILYHYINIIYAHMLNKDDDDDEVFWKHNIWTSVRNQKGIIRTSEIMGVSKSWEVPPKVPK